MSEIFDAYALSGGLLIGLSAVVFLLFNGRIAGISGMCSALISGRISGQKTLGLVFLLAMIAAGGLSYSLLADQLSPLRQGFSPLMLLVSGFLVGVGTRLSNGCTSGHGVCGLGRRSVRSLAATLCFMATGVLTVIVLRATGVLL